MLPFSTEQFFAVFAAYSAAIWPVQALAYGIAAVAAGAVLLHPSAAANRVAAAVLGAMWLWPDPLGLGSRLGGLPARRAAGLDAAGRRDCGYWPDPRPSPAARGTRPMTSGCAPEEAALGAAPASAFSLRGLCKTYRAGGATVQALRDLDIFAGEFMVLLGPSGSAKLTLRNILGGRGPSQLSRSAPRGQG